MGRVGEIVDWF